MTQIKLPDTSCESLCHIMDFHTHTNNSLDCKRTLDELCQIAVQKGIGGIAVTDHAETRYYYEHSVVKNMKNSIADVNLAKQKYSIKIFQGIELGSPFYDMEKTKEYMSLCDYDVVLASNHLVPFEGDMHSFAAIDFSDMPQHTIEGLVDAYFDLMTQMTQKWDFDILCHITYPFRYINGRYGRNLDVMKYQSRIYEIFEILISRQKALEINTASIGGRYKAFDCPCPDEYFIKKYYDMGGRLVTLGSDTHTHTVANGFDVVVPMLKKIGFDKITYFEKRKIFFELI